MLIVRVCAINNISICLIFNVIFVHLYIFFIYIFLFYIFYNTFHY